MDFWIISSFINDGIINFKGQQQKDSTLVENFHTLLNYIEELVESGKYRGSEERFYDIVEKSSSKRPVSWVGVSRAELRVWQASDYREERREKVWVSWWCWSVKGHNYCKMIDHDLQEQLPEETAQCNGVWNDGAS